MFSPQNPNHTLRPHGNLGPNEGENKDERAKGQKEHSAEPLLLGEAVHSAGEMACNGGQNVRKRSGEQSGNGVRDCKYAYLCGNVDLRWDLGNRRGDGG